MVKEYSYAATDPNNTSTAYFLRYLCSIWYVTAIRKMREMT